MIFLELKDIVVIHEKIIEKYGWLSWIKDSQQIESILQHIQNDEYYPNIQDKATHLFFSIVNFHCFNDWNKRTAIAATEIFLSLNEYNFPSFITKFEDIAIWVAKNELDKTDLKKYFRSLFMSFWYEI